jgi:PAS domain S-box-containing protein
VVGRPALEVIVPADHELSEVIRATMEQHGKREGGLEVFRKDGSIFDAYVRDVVMLADDATPTGTIAVSVDVSEQVEAERTLLASREYLRAVTDSTGEGVFTLDNDGCVTYVNGAGERLFGLRSDELMGRVMHEATHTHRADGSRLDIEDCPIQWARRDRRVVRIEQDVFVNRAGRQFPVSYTASPIETADGVQGCVVVFADISERLERERTLQREAEALSWIGRCKDAIAEERLLLYAQPIVDSASGETVQRELLLRIREPDGTISAPAPYLQIAERYGLIGDIDRWVIQRAIEIAADHHPVQVNISAHSISDWTILDHIERCIEQTGADPASLVFEITETALASDQDAAVRFAELLREIGCKVALDDFGTGYGSFTYIKTLPVDYLKIDMEFVRDVNENPASMRVVEAVVSIAQAFSAQTVGEGVEDPQTLERLRELGVDFAQGHYIARPGPISDAVPESPT